MINQNDKNYFLKNLQNKPEPVKRLIMWFGVFLAMTAIFTFWILTFPSQIPNTAESSDAAASLKRELPTVWQTLKTQINNLQNLWPK